MCTNQTSNDGLSNPIDVMDECYTLNTQKISESVQPWDGYEPHCTLHNGSLCKYYPVQTANIRADGQYDNIEIRPDKWVEMACDVALESVQNGGGPFGAVVLQIDGPIPENGVYNKAKILRYWVNHNQVILRNDPTAHAEVMTVRSACRSLGVFNLGEINRKESLLPQNSSISHCLIYSSCEPCPMCYSSISWSRIKTLLFAATRYDSAVQGVNFSDTEIYMDLQRPYSERNITTFRCITDNSLSAFNYYKRTEQKRY